MKSIQKYILFSLLFLGQQTCFASDTEETGRKLNKIAVTTAPVVAPFLAHSFKLSPFAIIHSFTMAMLIREQHLAKTTQTEISNRTMSLHYPDACDWYEKLAQKYPSARLEQKQLQFSSDSDMQTHITNQIVANYNKEQWYNSFGKIYCPKTTMYTINSLCKKKAQDQELTDCEQIELRNAELSVLREAGCVETNDTTNKFIAYSTLIAGVETTRQIYKKINPQTIKKSLPRRLGAGVGLFYLMGAAQTIPYNGYARHTEQQADKFANQLVDTKTLLAGKKHLEVETNNHFDAMISKTAAIITQNFNNDEQKKLMTNNTKKILSPFGKYLSSYSKKESRIKLIDDEIARRNQIQK